ncbi:MAG TPA: pyruvoyl-dependent arginine decarboxylase [Candidatus Saccharimonadales bacterium]|nr:pyruvoyl-dependent arginine decarboxylase [Candidatus Saccharimonadales bacterium]
MNIEISTGIGTGPTKLSAFDSALNDAGVANFNLIKLSSVIPPESKIIDKNKAKEISGKWGDRLYVVMAETRVDTPNTEAWAGIGWVQEKKSGKGLFVEHEGNSRHTVEEDIRQSLRALMATRNVDFGDIHMKVVGRTCKHEPVCALVVAVYQSSSWETK